MSFARIGDALRIGPEQPVVEVALVALLADAAPRRNVHLVRARRRTAAAAEPSACGLIEHAQVHEGAPVGVEVRAVVVGELGRIHRHFVEAPIVFEGAILTKSAEPAVEYPPHLDAA
jgi:hypothetical protein